MPHFSERNKLTACGVYSDEFGAVTPERKPQTANSAFLRCTHRTPGGQQCRLRVLDTQSGFCFRHARPRPVQSDADDLSAELLGELSAFECASEINQFLAKLLVLVTKGRVSPRRASVLAYITNQLLHSHRVINAEENAALDASPEIILDSPRPRYEAEPLVQP